MSKRTLLTSSPELAPRLLVVDDHRDTLELFSEYLSSRGCAVSTAATGEEALHILEREPSIDVVVLDVMFAGLSGLDTLQVLMQRKPRPGVVMVSALSDGQFAAEAYALGACDYLVKPIDPVQLEGAVADCLAHQGRDQPGGDSTLG